MLYITAFNYIHLTHHSNLKCLMFSNFNFDNLDLNNLNFVGTPFSGPIFSWTSLSHMIDSQQIFPANKEDVLNQCWRYPINAASRYDMIYDIYTLSVASWNKLIYFSILAHKTLSLKNSFVYTLANFGNDAKWYENVLWFLLNIA